MNRIILAYCRDNAELAETTDQQLSRIGIPFEHLAGGAGDPLGQFGNALLQTEDPVVLFVTENLLKNPECMTGTLPALQKISGDRRLVAVIADGKIPAEDGKSFEYVETHIDRMGHALKYMNFWQTAWLDLSSRYQHASGEEKNALEGEMNAIHHVANEIGEIINVLRENGYVSKQEFEADDFAAFFNKTGLQAWHEQYKRIAQSVEESLPPIPRTAPQQALAETPVITGILTPEPAEDEEFSWAQPETNGRYSEPEPAEEETPSIEVPDADINFAGENLPEPETPEAPVDQEAAVDQAIRDAWLWLEKGHLEQGFELFQFALEQHPDNARLNSEYQSAREKYGKKEAPEAIEGPSTAEETVPEQPAQEETADAAETPDNEAKSYELMGDMAAEKGDYLFAKYCWDRAAEIDPAYPGIYRKLGLMTSEHLQDYRETAVHYLSKALEQQDDDAALHLALAGAMLQNGDAVGAETHYTRAIMLDPSMRTKENEKQFTAPPAAEPVSLEHTEVQPEEEAVASADPADWPPLPEAETLTVLVTGATSGIGRATAELFARHGHRVILTGRRTERLVLQKTQFEEEYDADVLMLPFDVRDRDAVQAALTTLPEEWQNVDVLINNAGLAKGLAPIHEGDIDHWETMIDTNIKGLLYVTRAIAPGMVARKRGHIINIGSSAGKEVYPNGNVYCATKFAVDALTRAMRLDLFKHDVRVSQVSPGHVEETEFAITRFDGDAERANIYGDFQPLKAGDVAEAIYFLATRPPHVNVQDIWMYAAQQASSTMIDRSGR
ncbi:MAG: SDR family NAD(P)-dependent oxidoreductase [Saprospiraceae bacterium]|nr:SDR family NAD(P)-dependent oxidoreductase [Saprospiraceae bacterium]